MRDSSRHSVMEITVAHTHVLPVQIGRFVEQDAGSHVSHALLAIASSWAQQAAVEPGRMPPVQH